jgi:ubiquinone/menaquinone biosynthesis C-methylase UbiE
MSKAKHPWYSEEAGFFGKDYFKEYTSALTPEKTKQQVGAVIKLLKMKRGMKVLDLACGHGRHAIPLAKKGYKMTGLDLNGYFLQEAKKAAKKAKQKIQWIKSDMREIPFENEFDVVVNLFTSFGYLENDAEDQKVLHAVAKALKPKGKFLMNVASREWVTHNFVPRVWEELSDGSIVVTERKLNTVLGRMEDTRTRINKNGKKESFTILCRMYTIPELVRMGKEVDLRFKGAYGEDGKPHTFDSKRTVVVFQK